MKIDTSMCAKLRKHGFKWFKSDTTDRVDAEVIADIVPAADGFTVVYTEDAAIELSTAVVEKIDDLDDPNKWIYVHWKSISDQRR